MIVPGGGLSLDNARWVASRSNFLVHVNVLVRLFRGKMLAMLMDAHDSGQLKFCNTRQSSTNSRKTWQKALRLSRRKSAIAVKSGFECRSSRITSILRWVRPPADGSIAPGSDSRRCRASANPPAHTPGRLSPSAQHGQTMPPQDPAHQQRHR
jgi:hypothetical protein